MHVLFLALTIYLIGTTVILYLRPSVMFHPGGTWKEFSLNPDPNHTYMPFWLFSILWAFLSYLIATFLQRRGVGASETTEFEQIEVDESAPVPAPVARPNPLLQALSSLTAKMKFTQKQEEYSTLVTYNTVQYIIPKGNDYNFERWERGIYGPEEQRLLKDIDVESCISPKNFEDINVKRKIKALFLKGVADVTLSVRVGTFNS